MEKFIELVKQHDFSPYKFEELDLEKSYKAYCEFLSVLESRHINPKEPVLIGSILYHYSNIAHVSIEDCALTYLSLVVKCADLSYNEFCSNIQLISFVTTIGNRRIIARMLMEHQKDNYKKWLNDDLQKYDSICQNAMLAINPSS